jgi:hypothetical protein
VTLHLTYISNLWLVHVSDRLLTTNGTTFDARANKTVLFAARDALVVLGYAGLAALDGMYTDDWLAEKIEGSPLVRGPRGFPATRLGTGGKTGWPDIGRALNIFQTELTASVAMLPKSRRKIPQVIVCSGWQCARSPYHVRPIIGQIHHDGSGAVSATKSNRYWHLPSRTGGFPFALSAEPDGYVAPAELVELGATIAHNDPDAIEAVLVEKIRAVANNKRSVGDSCMSIIIPRVAAIPSRVRYLPASHEEVLLTSRRGQFKLGAVYTPWIVSAGFAQPPQLIAGSMRPGPISLGDRLIYFDLPVAAAPAGPIVGFAGSQPRRRPR